MALIVRPVKAFGQTTYVLDVAAALPTKKKILAVEVDGDLSAIITQVNGNLDNSNIAGGIATAKLAQDAGIVTGHLADGAVTGAKILDGSITAVDLAPDSVTTTKILDGAVTLAKMAPGSSVRYAEGPEAGATAAIGAETNILSFAAFTPEGTTSIISITATAHFNVNSTGSTSITVVTRLKRNGTTVVKTHSQSLVLNSSGIYPFTVTFHALQALLTGSQTFGVTAEVTTSSGTIVCNVDDVFGLLVEHA